MGDRHHAIAAGAMTRDDIHGQLADDDDEVFIFDSTGTALQDVATASIALRRAMERSVGVEIDFAPSA
jgi:alanine dehydrogenase